MSEAKRAEETKIYIDVAREYHTLSEHVKFELKMPSDRSTE